ncbi:MAG: sigma-70 family RNA polymerase sigma factor [Myxococcota bacterium]
MSTYDDHDDLELLLEWREGDREAGNELIQRHYPFAYKLAHKLLGGDTDGAQEVSQLAFETLLHKRDEIEKNVKGYLRRVVMLKVLSYRRRRLSDDTASELQAGGHGVESVMASREEIKLMVKALRSLSLGDQLLLAWVYGDERTQHEIAESLELGLAQCNSRISRARQRLKRRLEEYQQLAAWESTMGGFETWLASVHGRWRNEDR